jgi:hypothetical protein
VAEAELEQFLRWAPTPLVADMPPPEDVGTDVVAPTAGDQGRDPRVRPPDAPPSTPEAAGEPPGQPPAALPTSAGSVPVAPDASR